MDNKHDWRDRFTTLLKDAGMSKRGLSLKAGLNENFVSEMLARGKDPSVGNLIALSRVLGTTVADLMGETA